MLEPNTSVDFARIPANCKQDDVILLCDLLYGNSISKEDTILFPITLDVTDLQGLSLVVNAEVQSSGREVDPTDNKKVDYIKLVRYSEIDING